MRRNRRLACLSAEAAVNVFAESLWFLPLIEGKMRWAAALFTVSGLFFANLRVIRMVRTSGEVIRIMEIREILCLILYRGSMRNAVFVVISASRRKTIGFSIEVFCPKFASDKA